MSFFRDRFKICEVKKFQPPIHGGWNFLVVELEGIEPSSKRGTNVLSTCVVSG